MIQKVAIFALAFLSTATPVLSQALPLMRVALCEGESFMPDEGVKIRSLSPGHVGPGGHVIATGFLSGENVSQERDTGVFIGAPPDSTDPPRIVIREGDPVTGPPDFPRGLTFRRVNGSDQHLDLAGNVLLRCELNGLPGRVLVYGVPGSLQPVAWVGEDVSDEFGAGVTITNIDSVGLNASGTYTFWTNLSDFSKAIWDGSAGAKKVAVKENLHYSGLPETAEIGAIGLPKLNGDGEILFDGVLSGVPSAINEGIWLFSRTGDSTLLTEVIREGDPVTGEGLPEDATVRAVRGTGYPRSLADDGWLAFGGIIEGTGIDSSNDYCLWAGNRGTLSVVAREKSPAPDKDGNPIAPFTLGQAEVAIAANGHLLLTTMLDADSAQDHGLWFWDTSELRLLAREGDVIPDRSPETTWRLPAVVALSASGNVAMRVLGENLVEVWGTLDGDPFNLQRLFDATDTTLRFRNGNTVGGVSVFVEQHSDLHNGLDGRGFFNPRDELLLVTGRIPGGAEPCLVTYDGGSELPTGQIRGRVASDGNANGSLDASDPGYSTITLELFAADGAGNPQGDPRRTTKPDEVTGEYGINSVPDGDYVVLATIEEGVARDGHRVLSPIGGRHNVSVSGGVIGADFLVQLPPKPGSPDTVKGRIWQIVEFPGTFNSDTGAHRVEFRKDEEPIEGEVVEVTNAGLRVRIPQALVDLTLTELPKEETSPEFDVIIISETEAEGVVQASYPFCYYYPYYLYYNQVVIGSNKVFSQQVLPQYTLINEYDAVALLFLGRADDGTAALRVNNTRPFPTPLRLKGTVIGPEGEVLVNRTTIDMGLGNDGFQFPVDQDALYLIIVQHDDKLPGDFPAPFQVHLASKVSAPRKIIDPLGEDPKKEKARAIRIDTLFNHPAPRIQPLARLDHDAAQTGLFKFANPFEVNPYATAVLVPPRGRTAFPIGNRILRAPDPRVLGQLQPGFVDITVPTARTELCGAFAEFAENTVTDFTQVPVPASIDDLGGGESPAIGGTVCAAIGKNDNFATLLPLPFVPVNSIILDKGAGQEIVDGDGMDFEVYARAGSYQVAAGNTPYELDFRPVGEGSEGVQAFDLGVTGLTSARYLRITGTQLETAIDAVKAVNVFVDAVRDGIPVIDFDKATIIARRAKPPTPAPQIDPCLELVAPNGMTLSKGRSGVGDLESGLLSDAALINVDLPQIGAYRFFGRGYDFTPNEHSFGTLFAKLESGGDYDPVNILVSEKSEMEVLAQRTGKIASIRERDSYVFSAGTGQSLNIVVNSTGDDPLLNPVVELWDQEGFLIAANDDYPGRGRNSAISVTLPQVVRSFPVPEPGTIFELPSLGTYRIVVSAIDQKGGKLGIPSGIGYLRRPAQGEYELKVFTGTLRDRSIGAESFALWQEAQFTTEELADAEISGFSADPDRDGVPNGAEFVLDGLPKVADAGERVRVSTVSEGDLVHACIEISVIQNLAGNGALLQSSKELQIWNTVYDIGADPDFTSPLVIETTPGETTTQVKVRANKPLNDESGARYFRIAVNPTPVGGGGEIPEGAVTYYPFDGNANDSAGSNHGTVNGAELAPDRFGVANSAYRFDGEADDIILSEILTIGTGDHTLAAWVKIPLRGTEGLGNFERVGVFLGNHLASPTTNWDVHDDGQMRLYWNTGRPDIYATTDLRDNQWHHIAWVRDKTGANEFRFYIDGEIEHTHPDARGDITFTVVHRIGGDSRAERAPNFHGLIDELVIYDRALTEADIGKLAR